jgi:hypothetical protein
MGVAMLRDRRARYEASYEELVNSISITDRAEDQFGALALVGEAIDAIAQNVDPDSEEGIALSQNLRAYLQGSLRFIDGTASAYNEVYEGMKLRFPEL